MGLNALRAALSKHFRYTKANGVEAVEQFINHSLEALAIDSKKPQCREMQAISRCKAVFNKP